MSRVQVGKFLRGRREAAKISLRRAARGAGVSPTYLSDVELGRCLPSAGVARRVAVAIGAEVEEVLARLALETGVVACGARTIEEAREAVRRGEG